MGSKFSLAWMWTVCGVFICLALRSGHVVRFNTLGPLLKSNILQFMFGGERDPSWKSRAAHMNLISRGLWEFLNARRSTSSRTAVRVSVICSCGVQLGLSVLASDFVEASVSHPVSRDFTSKYSKNGTVGLHTASVWVELLCFVCSLFI